MRKIVPILPLALLLALVACTTFPQTPKQSLAASYVTVETLAESAFIAHRDGHITDQQRGEIREDLQQSLDYLTEAEAVIESGGDAQSQLTRARVILEAVQSILEKQVPEDEQRR